ncbi:outer membrane protein assembly factor BamB family protein [Paractinoplanes maris]|uniref:outer membrane protein assembly factor BamB family protein n=1 Tax=Paractinoplanes maris TaxID=1734446 RepID=UPI0020201049|nr:PQQ-binding-like beta-propeller repeat protein [Actinoplanes maris]
MKLLLAALLALPVAAPAATPTWAQEGYGPGRNYYNPDEPVINATTVGRLEQRWAVSTPVRPGTCTLPGPPLAAAGRLVATDPTGVTARGATTGKRLWHWSFPVRSPGRQEHFGQLALAGDRAIALTNPCDPTPGAGKAAYLTAIDTSTGAQRWRVTMNQFTTIMVIDRGVAVVGNWGGFGHDPATTTGYRVSDGVKLWQVSGYRLDRGVAAGGRVLLTSTDDRTARAVSSTTGKLLWRTEKPWKPLAAAPDGSQFLVSTDGDGVTSVDAATGKVRWSTRHDGPVAHDGRHVFLPYHRGVETFDAVTGRLIRVTPLAGRGGQPVRAGGLLYLTVDDRPPAVLDAGTGRTVATSPDMADLGQPPVIVDGWLYTTDGETLRGYTIR